MAKTEGQLFSIEASGTFAKILTYQGRRYFRHTHKKNIPRNPRTEAQKQSRTKFAAAVNLWHRLTEEQKQVYREAGSKDNNILGINELIKIDADHAADCVQFGQNKKFGQLKFAGPRLL
ncbi:MAG: hypothetical protein DRO11_03850 [Methanobacteriota archaeon]|nr:MAG: hypothetical protein DRO11_03850 [Euryarchaeota archaeon]